VQPVGFRRYVLEVARRSKLNGYVRNACDILLLFSPKILDKLLRSLECQACLKKSLKVWQIDIGVIYAKWGVMKSLS